MKVTCIKETGFPINIGDEVEVKEENEVGYYLVKLGEKYWNWIHKDNFTHILNKLNK